MTYTKNWNESFIKNVNKLKLNNLDLCLEIGCFEGLTSNYIADNLLSSTGKLICVDPLEDKYLTTDLTDFDEANNKNGWAYFSGQYDRFIANTSKNINENKIELIQKTSFEAYSSLKKKYKNKFDFIFIDGDHREASVYKDAINCFTLCKTNGYILFDDYLWEDFSNKQVTKKGIDRFLNEYSGQYELLIHDGQIAIKKI